MDLRTAMLKALEKKFREQLHEVNSKLASAEDRTTMEAQNRAPDKQKTRQQIDQEFQGLKPRIGSEVVEIKAQIHAEMSKFKSSTAQLAVTPASRSGTK